MHEDAAALHHWNAVLSVNIEAQSPGVASVLSVDLKPPDKNWKNSLEFLQFAALNQKETS